MSLRMTSLQAVSLRRLLPHASFVGCADIPVANVTDRHDQCEPGDLFAAIAGAQFDGREFVSQVLTAGVRGLLISEPLAFADIPQCIVPDVRAAYCQLKLALAGYPQRRLQTVGITGTNGKTTVSWLVRSIFRAAGRPVGLLGTVEYSTGACHEQASLTTPGPETLAHWFSRMVTDGARHAVIELSSHALDQSRVAGVGLAGAVVTNVTRDHFDYHGDFETYLAAKCRIGSLCGPTVPLVYNADDSGARELAGRLASTARLISCRLGNPADARVDVVSESLAGTHAVYQVLGERFECSTQLVGRHNLMNCLSAAAVAIADGVAVEHVVAGVESLNCVPGRLQNIDLGQSFAVFVDYAHTPDALQQVITALRRLTSGRLICVFGAGGDRDREKRSLLGAAASKADVAVITSDNPRSEDPLAIIRSIETGVCDVETRIEPDRGDAIAWAIQHASPGDCVLIAGKGHEACQQVGAQRLSFDDRAVARQMLEQTRQITGSRVRENRLGPAARFSVDAGLPGKPWNG